MKQKKPKMRSFARRLTRRIALTQLVVMGLASYLIYQTARFFVKFRERHALWDVLTYQSVGILYGSLLP